MFGAFFVDVFGFLAVLSSGLSDGEDVAGYPPDDVQGDVCESGARGEDVEADGAAYAVFEE